MKYLLILLLLPFISVAQPTVFRNPYSGVKNPGNLGRVPYQERYFRGFGGSDSLEVMERDSIVLYFPMGYSNKKMIQPSQFRTGVKYMWDLGYTGKNVKVCLIDESWTDLPEHNGISVTDFMDNGYQSVHTLSMAGLIAGRDDGNYAGALGNAYDAELYIYSGGWGAQAYLSMLKGWENGCKIYNISMDILNPGYVFKQLIRKITDNGGIVVVAAGNRVNGIEQMKSMCVPGVVAVSSLYGEEIEAFSDSMYTKSVLPLNGKYLDFTVPRRMLTMSNFGGPAAYTIEGGSSASAAYMSGMFAQLIEKYPNVRGDVLVELMKIKSRKITGLGVVSYIPNMNFLK